MGADISMDRIIISEISAKTIIGTYKKERLNKQELLISGEFHCDLRAAGKSDRLQDTVNYKKLKNDIIGFVESSAYKLIESVAEGIAELSLGFPGVKAVKIRVEKPGALSDAKTVAVEIERTS